MEYYKIIIILGLAVVGIIGYLIILSLINNRNNLFSPAVYRTRHSAEIARDKIMGQNEVIRNKGKGYRVIKAKSIPKSKRGILNENVYRTERHAIEAADRRQGRDFVYQRQEGKYKGKWSVTRWKNRFKIRRQSQQQQQQSRRQRKPVKQQINIRKQPKEETIVNQTVKQVDRTQRRGILFFLTKPVIKQTLGLKQIKNNLIEREKQDYQERASKLVDNGYLKPRQRAIIKGAMKDNDFEELKEWVPKIEKKARIQEQQIIQENKRQQQLKQKQANIIFGKMSHKELSKEKIKTQQELEKLHKDYQTLRPDERTQKRARLSNKWDYLAERKRQIELVEQERRNRKLSNKIKNALPFRKEKEFKPVSPERRRRSKEIMEENKELYDTYLKSSGYSKLPKDSKLNFLQIASLMRRIKNNSADYKADSIIDDLDHSLEYEENLKIIEKKYPDHSEKTISKMVQYQKIEEKQEFLENYYLEFAEKNPKDAIADSQRRDDPVRKIRSGPVNKRWLKNPASKSGADYEGIDDGTEPFTADDF
jgi:hypothetical protein